MKKQYVIMVINHIFEGENMLIVKSEGGQMIKKYSENISVEDLNEYLELNEIDKKSCVINVVEEGWDGNPRIRRW